MFVCMSYPSRCGGALVEMRVFVVVMFLFGASYSVNSVAQSLVIHAFDSPASSTKQRQIDSRATFLHQDNEVVDVLSVISKSLHFAYDEAFFLGQFPRKDSASFVSTRARGFVFEGGYFISSRVRLGVRWSRVGTSVRDDEIFFDRESGATHSSSTLVSYSDLMNTNAVLSYFPKKTGQFIKIGFGLAIFDFYYSRQNESSPETLYVEGISSILGFGYQVWQSDFINVTASAHYYGNYFVGEGGAHFGVISLGVGWQ